MYQIIVFGPLLAALIAGLFGRSLGDKGAQAITCGSLILYGHIVLGCPV